jgi:hypothetical protein
MRLPILLRISNSLLQYLLCFFYKLPMQVNRIVRYPSLGIIFPENIIGSLLVVLIHLRRMLFPLFRKLMRRSAISALVCLVRLPSISVLVLVSETGGARPCRNMPIASQLLVARDLASGRILLLPRCSEND